MQKLCPECQEVIKGRSDKKFCSDLCRNSYNNRINSNAHQQLKTVNTILKRNRKILEKLMLEKVVKAHKEELLKKGFDPNYFTNTQEGKQGKVCYFCYEYGFIPFGNEYFQLIRKQT